MGTSGMSDLTKVVLKIKKALFGEETLRDVISLSWVQRGWNGAETMRAGRILALSYVIAVTDIVDSLPNPKWYSASIKYPLLIVSVLANAAVGVWCIRT